MQKTLLKFAGFELIERVCRFRLLLHECADSLSLQAPVLYQQLLQEADALEARVLEQKTVLNRLFSENTRRDASEEDIQSLLTEVRAPLRAVSRLVLALKSLQPEPETFLFLRDALPEGLLRSSGEQSIFLTPEGEAALLPTGLSPRLAPPLVLLDTLSVLQKNNPLGWLGLTAAYSAHIRETAVTLEAFKLELAKNSRKKSTGKADAAWTNDTDAELLADALLEHAISLRLLGPAYYFHALACAVLNQDEIFLNSIEPALFFGLNHQNFSHKSLVILHEACERSKASDADSRPASPWSEETLSSLYRSVEKLIPAKWAFSEKNMERALQLRDRLSQGVLLSASPLYSLGEVADSLAKNSDQPDFSIYDTLGLLTESPHSPREIVNAGWLHKMDRSSAWLYSLLNEDAAQGFERLSQRLDDQDNLLRKSIDVSEVHRVLLCSL